jgi:chromosomal replication initiation ATPase DnaA
MMDEKRLEELFRLEYEQTKRVGTALMAVARAVLAHQEEQEHRRAVHRTRSIAGMPDGERGRQKEMIYTAVAEEFQVPRARVTAKGRLRGADARMRFCAMALLRRLNLSYPEIAYEVGLENHTSVIHGLRALQPDELARVDRLWMKLNRRWGVVLAPAESDTGKAA